MWEGAGRAREREGKGTMLIRALRRRRGVRTKTRTHEGLEGGETVDGLGICTVSVATAAGDGRSVQATRTLAPASRKGRKRKKTNRMGERREGQADSQGAFLFRTLQSTPRPPARPLSQRLVNILARPATKEKDVTASTSHGSPARAETE